MDKPEIRNDEKTEVAPWIDSVMGQGETFKKLQMA